MKIKIIEKAEEIVENKCHRMTLEQWQKRNPDIEDTLEECDECNGTGTHECECGDEHDCGFCDGTGYQKGETVEAIYRRQALKDQMKLRRWMDAALADPA